MLFILTKHALTAAVIVIVSEIAKRSDKMGALSASLPIVTLTVMLWLYVENQGVEKIANHACYTFWYVIPTLPMFLAVPFLLHRGINFWIAMAGGVLVTVILFAITAVIVKHLGIDLMP
jgi:hypothetical protein